MKVTIILDDTDLGYIRDVALSALGKKLTNEEALELWEKLPEDIKNEAVSWGLSDTVVRDNIYEFLTEE